MKTNFINTSAEGLTNLLLNHEPVLKQNLEGEIVVEISLPLIHCYSKEFNITVCKYTGGLNYNNGLYVPGTTFPAHLTEGGKQVWNSFVKDCCEKLLDYIKNN